MANVWSRLWGSAILAAHLRNQRQASRWPRERLEAERDRRIRRMVRYAARTVPHYREWFARERLDPCRIRGAADLASLPVLDRDLVRRHPDRFVSEAAEAVGAVPFLTSGSTGTPIRVYHDRRSLLANIAYGEREREPVNRLCGTFRPRELYVGYDGSTFKKVMAFYCQSVLLPVRPRRSTASLLDPVVRIAERCNEERPDVLVGYGGWIELFFRTVEARRIAVHLPRLVMYIGETLPHGARAFIQERFGVPVLSRYNAVEAFKIGFTCERGCGFHLHEDLCHVRVVGSDGHDVPAGEQGRVVISNLVNRATVLLNYPIGDVASLEPEPCACGRTLRRLSELEGRAEDILQLENGRFVHPRAVWEVLKNEPELLQYRLTQVQSWTFDLELVAADEAAFDRIAARVALGLQALLGPEARIKTLHRPETLRSGNAKFRAVVSQARWVAG